MSNSIDIGEDEQHFLIELFNKTKGELAAKVSMQDIGAPLGMDKAASSRMAEILIGWELVEVKALSGAIGITKLGVEEARKLTGEAPKGIGLKLGDVPILDVNACRAIEQVTSDLKSQAGKLGLDFETLTECMADLKTIDAQLTSSRPKTAIIRECFRSIKGILEKAGAGDALFQVKELLG